MGLFKRISVALFFIPVIVYFVLSDLFYNIFWLLFLLALIITSSLEFINILKKRNVFFNKTYLLGFSIFIILCFYFSTFKSSLNWMPYFSFIFVNFLFFTRNIFLKKFDNAIELTSAFTLFSFYISFLLGHLILLKSFSDGSYFLLFIMSLIWFNDTFAYFCGTVLGKRKWNIKASPNKSYAGAVSGIFFSTLGMFFINYLFKNGIQFKIFFLEYNFKTNFVFSPTLTIIIGIIFGIIIIFSDLIESMFKRCAGLKDSNKFLPGHGGVLDVFDSIIFTGPLFYYFILLLKEFNIIKL